MRITKITVTKLFGIFDHEIPLNLDDRITIIHSLNGFGKTTILRMLHGLFNGLYAIFFSIPFESFRVDFDDNTRVWVDKDGFDIANDEMQSSKKQSSSEITFNLLQNGESEPKSFSSDSFSLLGQEIELSSGFIDTLSQVVDYNIPELEKVKSNEWVYDLTGERLSPYDVLKRFGYLLGKKIPEWWDDFLEHIKICFIQTQRLQNIAIKSGISRSSGRNILVPAVEEYARDLKGEIQLKLAESASKSQSLDGTFPERLIRQMEKKDKPDLTTDEEISYRLKELEEKRSRLIEAGLIDENMGPSFSPPQNMEQRTKRVLAVYAEDVEKKLAVFDDIADRINLFKIMINKRFLYKEITISKESGFYFTASDGKTLSLRALSSGEQHELVLLYQLLFKTEPDTLVLIDEPEISLHVAWQVEFLKDLQEIVKIAKIDVLLATHSPQIINDRWDLTVGLEAPVAYAEISHTG